MDPDAQIVLSYYSHYIMLPGYDRRSAMAASFARVPSIPANRRGTIAAAVTRAAQRGESVARAIEAIASQGGTATLRSTLGGFAPPATGVQVRVLFTASNGNVRTILVNTTWDATVAEIEELARDTLRDVSGAGDAWIGAVFSVRGPTLLPSQQSQ